MAIPLGKKIQDLERIIIINLKETELVEHPHFYHGDIRDSREPLTLSYKVGDSYKQDSSYDPLSRTLPIEKQIGKTSGVAYIQPDYDPQTGVHTIKISLNPGTTTNDALDIKYRLLLIIDDMIKEYLREYGKIPLDKVTLLKNDEKKKGKQKKHKK